MVPCEPTFARLPCSVMAVRGSIPPLLMKKCAIDKINEIKRRDQRDPEWHQSRNICACMTSLMCPSVFNVAESTVQNLYENERDVTLDCSLAAVNN